MMGKNTEAKATKVYGIYIRVSTEKQSNDGDSIEMQENMAKEIIKSEGGVLYKVYLESAVSATKTKLKDRKGLMECLSDAKSGLFNHLIVYRRDRLARQTEDSLAIRKMLEESKCEIVFSAKGEQQMILNDPVGKLMENIHSSIAEIESAQTAIRVSDTMKDKARRGEFSGGNLPYGYETIDKRLVPIESEKGIIKEIEDLYLTGHGVYSIMKWLEGKEVRGVGSRQTPAIRKKQYKSSSERWTKEVVTSILFNPTYSGYMEYSYEGDKRKSDSIISVQSDRIIPIRSEETQERINTIRENKKQKRQAPRRYNTQFLLTGLLICKECGQEYRSRSSSRKDGTSYSYYICKGKDNSKVSNCTNNNYKKEILEDFAMQEVKKYIHQFLQSDTYEIIQKNLQQADTTLEKSLSDTESQIKRVEKDFASLRRLLLDLDTDDEMYETMRDIYQADQKATLIKLNDLKKTKTEIENKLDMQIEKEYDTSELIDTLQDFGEAIEHAPIHLKKQLLDKIFTSIEIDRDKQVTFNLALTIERRENNSTEVSFVSLGGVGDTTQTKTINIKLSQESFNSNVSTWSNQILSLIKSTFFDFLTGKNPQLANPKEFTSVTGLTPATYRDYKNKRRFPTLFTLNDLLEKVDSNIDEFSQFISNDDFKIDVNSIETVLSNFGNQRGA